MYKLQLLLVKKMAVLKEVEPALELDRILQKTEFENNKQLKDIQTEREKYQSYLQQYNETLENTRQCEEATSELDRQAKAFHSQFKQHKDNQKSLKQTLSVLEEHEEALKRKLQEAITNTQQSSMQQHEALEKYQSVWSSYKCVYESSNEAQNLLQAEEKFRGYLAQDNHLQSQIESLESSLRTMDLRAGVHDQSMTEWIVQIAALRVETMATSNMLKQMWAAVKELEIEIGTLENELANKQTEAVENSRANTQLMAPPTIHSAPLLPDTINRNDPVDETSSGFTSSHRPAPPSLGIPSYTLGRSIARAPKQGQGRGHSTTPGVIQSRPAGHTNINRQIPQLSIPGLSLQRSNNATISTSRLPTGLQLPTTPVMPRLPATPQLSVSPQLPSTPRLPATFQLPATPRRPETPQLPTTPRLPVAPLRAFATPFRSPQIPRLPAAPRPPSTLLSTTRDPVSSANIAPSGTVTDNALVVDNSMHQNNVGTIPMTVAGSGLSFTDMTPLNTESLSTTDHSTLSNEGGHTQGPEVVEPVFDEPNATEEHINHAHPPFQSTNNILFGEQQQEPQGQENLFSFSSSVQEQASTNPIDFGNLFASNQGTGIANVDSGSCFSFDQAGPSSTGTFSIFDQQSSTTNNMQENAGFPFSFDNALSSTTTSSFSLF